MKQVRVDKWLWAARFFKTRSAAAEAVTGGRVHVNDARVKPAKEIRAGDTVVIRKDQLEWTVDVLAVSDRRGPASVAATLYEERPESRAKRDQFLVERRVSQPLGAELGERPTKRARRRLDALRRGIRR